MKELKYIKSVPFLIKKKKFIAVGHFSSSALIYTAIAKSNITQVQ